ncbi:Phage Tail Collar Domain [Catalinimonas alkaloidigena]|uniref:Phage Tail Collar Domain n=1 Tax=Catalinimonas alkaloidigena TaxID=1075417 RepID=A0A1G9D930_9BACT|nr:Phage Tail Collar Domain [Catalinimonas alkaloidigena]
MATACVSSKRLINQLSIPPGTLVAFAGHESAIPEGWLLCNGRYLSVDDERFQNLFTAIGYTWGGNREKGFRLPDLDGYFLRGVTVDTTRDYGLAERFKVGEDGEKIDASGVGSYQLDATALPRSRVFLGGTSTAGSHSHAEQESRFPNPDEYGTLASGGVPSKRRVNTSESGNHVHSVFINRGGDRETRPANVAVYYIIKM